MITLKGPQRLRHTLRYHDAMKPRRPDMSAAPRVRAEALKSGDAIISGLAFEYAASVFAILQPPVPTGLRLTTEMVATADAFVRVVLLSERIAITQLYRSDGTRYPVDAGSRHVSEALQEWNCFLLLEEEDEDVFHAYAFVSSLMESADPDRRHGYEENIYLSYEPDESVAFCQDMLVQDLIFVESALRSGPPGAFKAVFPGERLYLGARVPTAGIAPVDVADVAAQRMRDIVSQDIEVLNGAVALGGRRIPNFPPIFLARLLAECQNGMPPLEALISLRNAPAMRRFRAWAGKAGADVTSDDQEKRLRGIKAIATIDGMSQAELSLEDFSSSVLKVASSVAKAEPFAILVEVVKPLFAVFAGWPISGLRAFRGKQVAAKHIDLFLLNSFKDTFLPIEFKLIAEMLRWPETARAWVQDQPVPLLNIGHMATDGDDFSRWLGCRWRVPQHDPELLQMLVEGPDLSDAR